MSDFRIIVNNTIKVSLIVNGARVSFKSTFINNSHIINNNTIN